MIKLLIFDLDGTLADTGRDIADAINYAVEYFGQRRYSVEEAKSMVGAGISSLLESLIAPLEGGDSPGAKELVTKRFVEYYSQHLLDNSFAYPKVKETLAALGSYKKVVLTNKREKFSKQILDGMGLLDYFDLVWGSDNVREKKPSPVPVLDLMKKFNVYEKETVIIGDSNYDVEAGKAANINVIGVTYGFRSREFLEGSDFIIDGFDELLMIMQRLNSKTQNPNNK